MKVTDMPTGKQRQVGIKKLSITWISIILFVVLLQGAGLLVTTRSLDAMSQRIFIDASGLQANHAFEIALLSQRRADLLLYLTGAEEYRQQGDTALREAGSRIAGLRSNVTSRDEQVLVDTIEQEFRTFTGITQTAVNNAPELLSPLVDRLLETVHQHRDLNAQQMQDTVRASMNLHRLMDALALALFISAVLVVGVGGLMLWRKIFHPILLLSQTAQAVQAGNNQARAQILRHDELGALNTTFNEMVDAISQRAQERRDFVAAVAHDVKSPLIVVSRGVELSWKAHDSHSAEKSPVHHRD